MAYFRALIRQQMDERWREEHQTLNKGKQWLKVNVGYGEAVPGAKQAEQFHPYLATPRQVAQFTYAMTAHAPIGAYQKCFKLRDTDECPRCDIPQTRDHVLSACGRYSSLSLDDLHMQRDSIFILANFLKAHPAALSFTHTPYKPP